MTSIDNVKEIVSEEPPMKKRNTDIITSNSLVESRIHPVLLFLTEPLNQVLPAVPAKEVLYCIFDPKVAPPPTPEMLPENKREEARKMHERIYKDGHTFDREKLSNEILSGDYISSFEVLDEAYSEEAFYWIFANVWNPKPLSELKVSPDFFYVYDSTFVYDPTGIAWFEFDAEKEDTPVSSIELSSDTEEKEDDDDDEKIEGEVKITEKEPLSTNNDVMNPETKN